MTVPGPASRQSSAQPPSADRSIVGDDRIELADQRAGRRRDDGDGVARRHAHDRRSERPGAEVGELGALERQRRERQSAAARLDQPDVDGRAAHEQPGVGDRLPAPAAAALRRGHDEIGDHAADHDGDARLGARRRREPQVTPQFDRPLRRGGDAVEERGAAHRRLPGRRGGGGVPQVVQVPALRRRPGIRRDRLEPRRFDPALAVDAADLLVRHEARRLEAARAEILVVTGAQALADVEVGLAVPDVLERRRQRRAHHLLVVAAEAHFAVGAQREAFPRRGAHRHAGAAGPARFVRHERNQPRSPASAARCPRAPRTRRASARSRSAACPRWRRGAGVQR